MIDLDVDLRKLKDIGYQLEATPGQISSSLNRARKRTSVTVNKLTRIALREQLDLKRNSTVLKRRLKRLYDQEAAGIWVGLNDFLVEEFKGKPVKTEKGIMFRGVEYKGAFFVRFKNSSKRRMVRRRTRKRLPIDRVKISVYDKAYKILEKDIAKLVPDIFLHHFEIDLKSRVKYLS